MCSVLWDERKRQFVSPGLVWLWLLLVFRQTNDMREMPLVSPFVPERACVQIVTDENLKCAVVLARCYINVLLMFFDAPGSLMRLINCLWHAGLSPGLPSSQGNQLHGIFCTWPSSFCIFMAFFELLPEIATPAKQQSPPIITRSLCARCQKLLPDLEILGPWRG